MVDQEEKECQITLTDKEAIMITLMTLQSFRAHEMKPYLYPEELALLESLNLKIKKAFYPEEYNRIIN